MNEHFFFNDDIFFESEIPMDSLTEPEKFLDVEDMFLREPTLPNQAKIENSDSSKGPSRPRKLKETSLHPSPASPRMCALTSARKP